MFLRLQMFVQTMIVDDAPAIANYIFFGIVIVVFKVFFIFFDVEDTGSSSEHISLYSIVRYYFKSFLFKRIVFHSFEELSFVLFTADSYSLENSSTLMNSTRAKSRYHSKVLNTHFTLS